MKKTLLLLAFIACTNAQAGILDNALNDLKDEVIKNIPKDNGNKNNTPEPPAPQQPQDNQPFTPTPQTTAEPQKKELSEYEKKKLQDEQEKERIRELIEIIKNSEIAPHGSYKKIPWKTTYSDFIKIYWTVIDNQNKALHNDLYNPERLISVYKRLYPKYHEQLQDFKYVETDNKYFIFANDELIAAESTTDAELVEAVESKLKETYEEFKALRKERINNTEVAEQSISETENGQVIFTKTYKNWSAEAKNGALEVYEATIEEVNKRIAIGSVSQLDAEIAVAQLKARLGIETMDEIELKEVRILMLAPDETISAHIQKIEARKQAEAEALRKEEEAKKAEAVNDLF